MNTIDKDNKIQSDITVKQLIDNHNCMVFNKLYIANIKRFIPSNNKQVKYYGMNYIVK